MVNSYPLPLPILWSITIIIILAQIGFLYKFSRIIRNIHSKFYHISDPHTFEHVIDEEKSKILNLNKIGEAVDSIENRSDDFGNNHREEFRRFIHQYLGTLLKGGTSISWSEIRSEIFLPATKNDENARIWMNNIIVLGLLGTASSFAVSLVFAAKTGATIIATILNVVPLAFIPAAIGLLGGIVCSLALSNKFSNAEDEANRIVDRLKQNLPYPHSVADILRKNFSEELRDVLKEFPDRLSFAFDSLQNKLENIGFSLGRTLEELPEIVRRTMMESSEYIHKAAKEVSNQFEGFAIKLAEITENFERQLPPFITAIESMGENTRNLQDTAIHFSQDLRDLVSYSRDSQTVLDLLIENVKSASQILSINLDKFRTMSEEFVTLYRRVHDEYVNYADGIESKIEKLITEVRGKNEEMVSQIYIKTIEANRNLNDLLNQSIKEELIEITKEIEGITENLFNSTKNHVSEFFMKTLNQIQELNINFNNCSERLRSFQNVSETIINNMENTGLKLENAGKILKEAVDNSKEIPVEVKIFSETLEKHRNAIGDFQNAAMKLNSHMDAILRGIDEGEKIKTKILDEVWKQMSDLKNRIKNFEDQVIKSRVLTKE